MEKDLEHIAIIMDGNRRWAKEKNLKPIEGHKEGAETLKKIIRYANKIGLKYLTVYAFSTENWKRSEEEVGGLMLLFKKYLEDLANTADKENVKVRILGHIEELSSSLQKLIAKVMNQTEENTGTVLNIAFNYGGRDEIVKAVKEIANEIKENNIQIEDINEKMIAEHLYLKNIPDPDLVIRTSGEIRVSNFLIWEIAFSEFLFIEKYWPDFSERDLDEAIEVYSKRIRRVGK